jgi:photosystem II stability/assembly factor-like uncharacterized protein
MRTRPGVWAAVLVALTASLVIRLGLSQQGVDVPHFDEPDAAARFEYARRRPADAGIDVPALYEAARQQATRLSRFSSAINRTLPSSQPPARLWLSGHRVVATDRTSPTAILDAWTPLGPGNVGGRTRVVRFHPIVHTTLFAAGVSGGIWKSDDDGVTWRPIGDGLTNIAVNALAIDPQRPSIMFAGTGEGYFREEIRGTGLPLRGGGIFVSADDGNNWRRPPATNTPDFHWVNDLELGVADSRRLYAATRSGVWRSNDSGETWMRLLETNVRGGCLDLVLRPDRSEDVLFASCGSYEQATVYRFPSARDRPDVEIVLREPNMGRTSLAIAPSQPDVMYALAASNDGGPGGNYRQGLLAVYRSDRGGLAGTWQARVTHQDPTYLNTLLLTNAIGASVRDCSPQAPPTVMNTFTNMGWYINVIAVDPRDPDRVWAAGVDWFRSDDGGRNWGLASFGGSGFPSYAHVDQHGIAFHPRFDGESNQVALIGNDGGVYRTANARAAVATGSRAACNGSAVQVAWTSLNRGYGVTQFYHGVAFDNGTRYLGGAQDNGTLLGSDSTGPDGWRGIYGGDGSYSAVNPDNPQVMYAQFQWSSIGRSTNGGQAWTTIRNGLDPVRSDTLGPEANYLFITPLAMDPSSPQRLWLGGEYLYRTADGGSSWAKASTSPMPDGGLVSAIAVAPGDGQIVVAGTSQGDILQTRNGIGGPSSPQAGFDVSRPRSGWVTSVAIDSSNAEAIYATYGNFGGAHVFRSTNRGASWQSLDGTGAGALPDIPVHSIVVDPDDSSRLYLGTDLGVMTSVDGGRSWMMEETGFGPAVTEWLTLIRGASGEKLLFAFTHGRGAWRVRLR